MDHPLKVAEQRGRFSRGEWAAQVRHATASLTPPDALMSPSVTGRLRATMRFGIFYEHQLPRPWAPSDEHRLLKDALEQVELADRLGIDYVWLVEHHLQKWKLPPTILRVVQQAGAS